MYLQNEYLRKVDFAVFLAKFFIFCAKMSMVLINMAFFQLWAYVTGEVASEFFSDFWPSFFVAYLTYWFASDFLSLFDESVAAMFTCMAVDKNCNARNAERRFGPEIFNNFEDVASGDIGGKMTRRRLQKDIYGPVHGLPFSRTFSKDRRQSELKSHHLQ